MKKPQYVYLIKKIITTWDGCNGCESDSEYLNWVFGTEEKAWEKCAYFNKEYSSRGPGYRKEYEVEKQEVR